MQTYRVSSLCAFARWLEDDESDPTWLTKYLSEGEESEAMRKGTAFHKFMETLNDGKEFYIAEQDGYTFHFTGEFDLYLPPMREVRLTKEYSGILVSGQADAPIGNTIYDHKTTEKPFDAEHYLKGYQHRFYMDLFNADRFVWNVWEMDELEPKVYNVRNLHKLETYRYNGMVEECYELAREFKAFAEVYLPDGVPFHKPTLQDALKASLRQ